jgi:hypothetical protein
MNIIRDPEEENPLARRLATLDLPGADELATRTLAAYHTIPQRRGPRRLVWAAVAAAVLITTVALGPAVVAAATPVAGRLLQTVGLAPKDASKIQAATGSATSSGQFATSSGQTVKLVGAYGDPTRTVVFVHLDGLRPFPGAASLTTASGQQLTKFSSSGVASDTSGTVPLVFEPITKPDPKGEELTLRITALFPDPIFRLQHGETLFANGVAELIRGEWVLRFRLQVASNQATPTLSSGRLGNVDVRFAAVGGTGDSIFVAFDEVGATSDELLKEPREGSASASPGQGAFKIQVFDRNGKELNFLGTATSSTSPAADKNSPLDVRRQVRWDSYWQGTGPGTYRVVLTYEGHELQTTFTINR